MLDDYKRNGESQETVENKVGDAGNYCVACAFSKLAHVQKVYADGFEQTK